MKNLLIISSNSLYGKGAFWLFLFFVFGIVSGNMTNSVAQKVTDPALNFTIFAKEDVIFKGREVEGCVVAGRNVIMAGDDYQISPGANRVAGFKVGGVPIGLAVRGGVIFDKAKDLKINEGHYVKIGNPTSPNQLEASYNGGDLRVRYKSGQGGTITVNSNPGGLSTPPVSAGNNPIFENIFGSGAGQIDVDAAFVQFSLTSTSLGALVNNVKIGNRDDSGAPLTSGPFKEGVSLPRKSRIILDANKINVLDIDASVWSNFGDEINFANFSSNPGFALIVNIRNANGKVTFPKSPDLQNNQGHVIYNFPGATSEIKLQPQQIITGIVLAPEAKITKLSGANLVGQIIAKSVEHDGDEIHFRPLVPDFFTRAISVLASTECLKDAPYLNYSVSANFDVTGLKATIEWLAPNGEIVETLANQPLSGKLLFPGARVNENGEGIAWPGWKIDGEGKWAKVDDLNSKLRLAGSKIRVTLNPVFVVDFSYPESTDDCFTDPPPSKTPLPVRLVSFKAAEREQQGVLEWVVADAVDFSHFDIEKSTDGVVFSRVGEVTFNPDQSRYQFTDNLDSRSLVYYRLKLVDLDGSSSYSHFESVKGSLREGEKLYGYPNPFEQVLTIVSANSQYARVVNLTGREVAGFQLAPGVNKINGSAWPAGVNLIRTENGEVIRVLKQR